MSDDIVSVERIIAAPPEVIFALLADPAQHPLIDGSATVIATKGPSETLHLGSKFGMSMKAGIKYSMESEVVEFEQDRRIAWQSRPFGFKGKLGGGRTWRYELEPLDEGTRVRETWDLTTDRQRRLLKLGGLPAKTRASMEKTLERIESITTKEG